MYYRVHGKLSIGLDRSGRISLSAQIYGSIRDAIESGQLAAGARLPSWSDLAAQLGVSRGTVRAAYERLVDEQFAIGLGAAGTRVAARPSPQAGHAFRHARRAGPQRLLSATPIRGTNRICDRKSRGMLASHAAFDAVPPRSSSRQVSPARSISRFAPCAWRADRPGWKTLAAHVSPLAALIAQEANMDLVGAGYDDFTAEQRDTIEMAYPHPPDFAEVFMRALYDSLEHRPFRL